MAHEEKFKIRKVQDVRFLREMLEFDVDAFLRERGWACSSSHPGSFWLWTKMIAGKAYTTDKATALVLEEAIEPDADEEPSRG